MISRESGGNMDGIMENGALDRLCKGDNHSIQELMPANFTWENCSQFRLNNTTLPPETMQHIILMAFFMVIALTGNVGVLIHMYVGDAWHKSVSLFVMSLAATDILIAIFSMSVELMWDIFGEWVFGGFACKVATYLQCTLFFSTAFILMSMSYDRYEAICKPMTFSRTSTRSRRMIIFSFILALILAIPQIAIFVQVEEDEGHHDGSPKYTCRSAGYTASWQRKMYVTWVAACLFIVPLIFMASCYVKIAKAVWENAGLRGRINGESIIISRKKSGNGPGSTEKRTKFRTLMLSICIIVGYITCWFPYFTMNLFNVWTDYAYKKDIPPVVRTVAQCMGWSSSCINPIIYAVFHCGATRGQKNRADSVRHLGSRKTLVTKNGVAPPDYGLRWERSENGSVRSMLSNVRSRRDSGEAVQMVVLDNGAKEVSGPANVRIYAPKTGCRAGPIQ